MWRPLADERMVKFATFRELVPPRHTPAVGTSGTAKNTNKKTTLLSTRKNSKVSRDLLEERPRKAWENGKSRHRQTRNDDETRTGSKKLRCCGALPAHQSLDSNRNPIFRIFLRGTRKLG